MEQDELILPDHDSQKLVVSEDIRSYIYQSSKWTKFLSIIGFVFSTMMVLISFSVGALMTAMNTAVGPKNNPYNALGPGVLTIILLLTAALYFYPSFVLFKFSNAAKQGVLYGDQESLNNAMSNLKSFFKFWGILLIVVLGIYALAILFAIVGAVAANIG
ncbi:magnesium-transporting ATPase (P-type) [Pedobacter sp. UYP24]